MNTAQQGGHICAEGLVLKSGSILLRMLPLLQILLLPVHTQQSYYNSECFTSRAVPQQVPVMPCQALASRRYQ